MRTLIAAVMDNPGERTGEMLDRTIRSLDLPRILSDEKIGREHFGYIAHQATGITECCATHVRSRRLPS